MSKLSFLSVATMRLVIASEKRSASFYARFSAFAQDEGVKTLFAEMAAAGIAQVQRLRGLLREVGKQIAEVCPVSQMRMG